MDIQTIHDSLINGQRQQMVKQIDEYGVYDFWSDYTIFLSQHVNHGDCYGWFSDAVIAYHRTEVNHG